ncbi:unnamed protein product [Lymnaea stagnalis]|uniref:Uncharacterized protein n=1 Tax=Lymnaea stagnalis TaxID=6523 RepID=A0AAV2HEY8_LYMST
METRSKSQTFSFDKRPLWRNLLSKDQRWITDPNNVETHGIGFKKKSLRSSTTATALKNRCLDNYKMEQDCESAVAMLHNQRKKELQKREDVLMTGEEFSRETQDARTMFESVLIPKHHLPACHRKVTIYSEKSVKEKSLALESVRPVLEMKCSTRKKFNHAKSSTLAYPEIQRHYDRINHSYRVVCDVPTVVDEEIVNSWNLSDMGHFFIVPRYQEPEVVSEPEVEQEEKAKEGTVLEIEQSEVLSESEKSGESEDLKSTTQSVFQIPEPVESVIPPPTCWLDSATVTPSSLSDVVSQEPASTVTTDTQAAPNHLRRSLTTESGLREFRDPSKRSLGNSVHLESKRSSPHDRVASETPEIRSPVNGEDDQKQNHHEAPKRNVSIHRPEVVQKKGEDFVPESHQSVESNIVDKAENVDEMVGLEVERKAEPPPYICPSSEKKSHDTEIRNWLKKSSFSSASKSLSLV